MEEKLKRNKAFWLSWKRDGLTNQELGKKYHLKLKGVKALKRALKLRGYDEDGEPMENRPRYYGRNKSGLRKSKKDYREEIES